MLLLTGCKSGPCITCYCYGKGCIAGRGDDFWHKTSLDELRKRLEDKRNTQEEINELNKTIEIIQIENKYRSF